MPKVKSPERYSTKAEPKAGVMISQTSIRLQLKGLPEQKGSGLVV